MGASEEILEPAFVDLQVNGYAGVDFNADETTIEQISSLAERLRQDGVQAFLPTVITDTEEAMCRRLRKLADAIRDDRSFRSLVPGFHIEGPFLNREPGFIGAHPAEAACTASIAKVERLLEAAGGHAKIVTLAPECDPGFAVTRYLADQGIVVAAGHSDASRDTLERAIDNGLSMFTHLGNGCPATLPRHDNIIQRVLSLAEKLTISLIADGAHIPPFVLRNYLEIASIDRCVVVTDAISAAGLGKGTFTLGNQKVEVGDDLVPWSADRTHFVGSAATMSRMVSVLQGVGVTASDIDKLVRRNPQRMLGLNLT